MRRYALDSFVNWPHVVEDVHHARFRSGSLIEPQWQKANLVLPSTARTCVELHLRALAIPPVVLQMALL